MTFNCIVYNIFISSPSDTQKERQQVSEVIECLNQPLARNGIILNPIKYEISCSPGSGSPQEIINDLLPKSDLCIAILRKKLGTPTKFYASGTEEEIIRFLEQGKEVMLYIYKNDGHINDIDDFVAKIRDRVLYREYKSTDDFKLSLYHDLNLRFSHSTQNDYNKTLHAEEGKYFIQFTAHEIIKIINSNGVTSITDNGTSFTIRFEEEVSAEMLTVTGYPKMPLYEILSPPGKHMFITIQFINPLPDIVTLIV